MLFSYWPDQAGGAMRTGVSPRLASGIMNILLDVAAHPVIGHRGNRAHSPENTLESLSEAVALGVDAVEFDLRVSRDSTLVLMHDPTIARTTSGTGAVAEMTVRELKSFDAGYHFTTDGGRTFPWRDRGVRAPMFDEVLETVRELPMIIELKTSTATELVRTAIARHNIGHRVVVAGFDSRAVHPLRGAGFPLGATTNDSIRLLPRAFLGKASPPLPFQTVNIPPTWKGMPVPFRLLTKSLRTTSTPVHVWTINDALTANRLWDAGVSGIISDDPATILRARDQRFK